MHSRSLFTLLSLSLSVTLYACGGSAGSTDEPTESAPSLVKLAKTGALPHSMNDAVLLLSEQRACVIDSYRVQVQCGDRTWTDTVRLGSEGRGPGEFERPSGLMRGDGGSIGVRDGRLRRLTVFSEQGELVRTLSLPFLFMPFQRELSRVIVGRYTSSFNPPVSAQGISIVGLAADDGTVLWEDSIRHPSTFDPDMNSEILIQAGGVTTPHGFVFGLGRDALVRYDPDGIFIDEFGSSEHHAELPNDRDVEVYAEQLREMLGQPPGHELVAEYRERPKSYQIRGDGSMVTDTSGRLWVATNRDREEASFLDVFRNGTFLGSVRVSGRLLGFDILESTLVTLAEVSETDSAGVPLRTLSWYRIVNR